MISSLKSAVTKKDLKSTQVNIKCNQIIIEEKFYEWNSSSFFASMKANEQRYISYEAESNYTEGRSSIHENGKLNQYKSSYLKIKFTKQALGRHLAKITTSYK